jgi:L-cysteine/cystine lyase
MEGRKVLQVRRKMRYNELIIRETWTFVPLIISSKSPMGLQDAHRLFQSTNRGAYPLITSTHIDAIREAMPATTEHIYLNTGTFGPLPNPVFEKMQSHLHNEWQQGRLGTDVFQNISATYDSARSLVARLLNASEDEIALTDNTGEGLNIVCSGFDWQAGDEVITTNHEHISALAPLYQLRDRDGIVIRTADLGPDGDAPLVDAIKPLITARTRLILLSHVLWTTGAVLDVASVARLAHTRQIPVLIDGAQSAGSIPVDVKALDVDFYAIPMQKWLCGPDGTGALYVRLDSLNLIRPTHVGYSSMKSEEGKDWNLHPSARCFELGGRQTAAVAGQQAALQWLETFVGHAWLFERISSLNTYAHQALKDIPGLTLFTPRPGASGLLAFKLEGRDDHEVVTQLQEKHDIYIRNIPSMGLLRVSTGFYNNEADIDAIAQALRML